MKLFSIFTSLVAATTTIIAATASSLPVDITEWINVESDRAEMFDGLRSDFERQVMEWERKINKELERKYNLMESINNFKEKTDEVEKPKNLSFKEQEMLQVENKIKQIISDISNSERDTIYQELFIPDNLLLKRGDWKKIWYLEDKIVFKLYQIIQKEVMSEFESSILYRSKPFDDFYLLTWGATDITDNGNEYRVGFQIIFVKNNSIIKQLDQVLTWKTKLHYTQNSPNKPLNLVKKASTFSLTIHKKMFSAWSDFATGWDLLNYIKGGLEEISINFRIEP